ncbi:hypothetical protein Py04_0904 [Pyrococcus sp. ST04]|nr:hypothetical protein Py04_0904 [Pyrococcus sp. ST04]
MLGNVNSLISQAFLLAGFLSFFSVGLGKYTAEFLGKGEESRIKKITGVSFTLPLLGLAFSLVNIHLAVLSTLRALQLTFRSFIYGLHKGEVYAYFVLLGFFAFLLGFHIGVLAPYYLLLGTISVLGILYSRRYFGIPGRAEVLNLAKYSFWAFVGSISGMFLLQGPYFLSEELAGAKTAGVVSAVLSTSFLLSYLPQVVQSAIVPLYAYEFGRGEKESIKKLAEESTLSLALLSSISVFILQIFAPYIESMFKIEFGGTFLIALIAVELYVTFNPLINMLSATNYIKDSALYSLVGASVAGISWLVLIPSFKEIGASLGLLLGYFTIFILVVMKSRNTFKVSALIIKPVLLAIPLQVLVEKTPFVFLLFLLFEFKDLKKEFKLFLRGIRF